MNLERIGMFFVLLAILATLFMFTGCSTLQLGDNATATERRAAICQDAQTAYTLSVVTLEAALPGGTGMSPQARAWWAAYQAGASLAIKTYCQAN